jgi:hypothetical protein
MKIPADTIMDKIIEYCNRNEAEFKEVGDILSSSEEFKKIFYLDCVKHNIIKDDLVKQMLNRSESLDEEW